MEMTLATWNVQTMLKPGRIKEIMEEIGKARVDVVAVQEIRWQGHGRIEKIFLSCLQWTQREDGSLWDRIYYKCKNEEKFSFFRTLNDRTCKLRLRGKFRNVTVISTCAPTEDSPDETKDEFMID